MNQPSMQSLRSAFCWLARMAIAISVGLLAAPAVWAANSDAPVAVEKSYVMAYMLTGLACALGIIIVGRPSHRTTEVKFFDEI